MTEINLIKSFYVFKGTGIITNKWIIYATRNNQKDKLFHQIIIHVKDEAERVFNQFKNTFPEAKVNYQDKTKCEKTKQYYKVLSEEIKQI